ncbi:aspartic proteinase-like protein 1 isoform X2 [Macadamia integrifolia]|uniref:aspartic proteinase-like protein 1 isoform X2 n=1 Tax=Macadamia integrifolia TaxID=60698 RepID=UPI001C4F02ED|nr:aspartic proteinase-like protein 1 isoform X2 [Macadamia integrifolia]
MFPFLLHWILGVIFSGFHVIAYSVLLFLPVTIVFWCSLVFGASIMQDKDMSEYSPSRSSTSKHLPCSHEFCELGLKCNSPTDPCPYIANYLSENTSSSGSLVEDVLHLLSSNSNASKSLVKAPVIVGCGRKQSGGYLDGVAPDGLLGLGFGDISVPSLLAKSGLVRNSFSICFNENDSGRIFFGDQGLATQQSTPLLPFDGKYNTYIVRVEDCCIGSSCLKQTGFQAQVDSGTSFTFLPDQVFEKVAAEFDRGVNATKSSHKITPLDYCYEASSQDLQNIPVVTLMFAQNNSFVVHNPVLLINGNQGLEGFCLAIMPVEGNLGTIGQNFMTGYRLVFDKENLKLGWSRSSCQDLSAGQSVPLAPPPHDRPQNPLPTNQQQRTPDGKAVPPAVASRTPSKPSAASSLHITTHFLTARLLPIMLLQLCLFALAT